VAEVDGDLELAAERHLAAAQWYTEIPHISDRVLALTAAARNLDRLPGDPRAGRVRAELVEFAHRNNAPGLLDLVKVR
jgi:hypothetical protein